MTELEQGFSAPCPPLGPRHTQLGKKVYFRCHLKLRSFAFARRTRPHEKQYDATKRDKKRHGVFETEPWNTSMECAPLFANQPHCVLKAHWYTVIRGGGEWSSNHVMVTTESLVHLRLKPLCNDKSVFNDKFGCGWQVPPIVHIGILNPANVLYHMVQSLWGTQ